jgi:hypothetical protein
VAALERFERSTFDPRAIRLHAERFSAQRFRGELRAAVDAAWAAHQPAIRVLQPA